MKRDKCVKIGDMAIVNLRPGKNPVQRCGECDMPRDVGLHRTFCSRYDELARARQIERELAEIRKKGQVRELAAEDATQARKPHTCDTCGEKE